MRGQKLFIRPIDGSDHDAIRSFLRRNAPASAVPATGLVGKLVGDIVAVLSMTLTEDALRIDSLVVAEELRRKRIGRFMIEEAVSLARKLEKSSVVWEGEHAFLERVGFVHDGGVMRRRVE